MPAITPSYLYTFVALIAVSGLLVFSFADYTNALRSSSELKQLRNLLDCVAAKGTELIVLSQTTNASTEAFVQMPASIGNKQYWLRLRNDSVKAWLEGGLGGEPVSETELRAYIPKKTSATGYYIGGYGVVRLECSLISGTTHIQLTGSGGGE